MATSLNNLALLYDSQGRYEEAEPLYLQALKIAEKVLGKNHPNTSTIRANYEQINMNQRKENFLVKWLKNLRGG